MSSHRLSFSPFFVALSNNRTKEISFLTNNVSAFFSQTVVFFHQALKPVFGSKERHIKLLNISSQNVTVVTSVTSQKFNLKVNKRKGFLKV